MAETRCFCCGGLGFDSWSGSLIPHAATKDLIGLEEDRRSLVPQIRLSAAEYFFFFFYKEMEDNSVLHLFLGRSVPRNLLTGTCIVGQWASEWGIWGNVEKREKPETVLILG